MSHEKHEGHKNRQEAEAADPGASGRIYTDEGRGLARRRGGRGEA
jgi:hypothetical protein